MSDHLPPTKPVDVEALRLVEAEMQFLASACAAAQPPGFRFLILTFEYDGGGLAWVGSAERDEMIEHARAQALRLEVADPSQPVTLIRSDEGGLDRGTIERLAVGARAVAELIQERLPEGWGHALLVWQPGGGGRAYIASGERDGMIEALREFAERLERGEDRPPGVLGREH